MMSEEEKRYKYIPEYTADGIPIIRGNDPTAGEWDWHVGVARQSFYFQH